MPAIHRCKFCGTEGHNAKTCPASEEPIGFVHRVGKETPTNYYKVSRAIGDGEGNTSGTANALILFNDREPGAADEALRVARQRRSVPGWTEATIAILHNHPAAPFEVGIVGRSNVGDSIMAEVEA